MRVLALGGAGFVGRWAVRTLARGVGDIELTVADRDSEAARRVATEHGAASRVVDVSDRASLDRALERADLVVNTVGPYFRFGVPVLRAALEAGCHYVDACDDPEPTLEMLSLASRAQERGVTAVVGMGISPGVTNLLAALAIGELDDVHEVMTGWDEASARPDTIGAEPSAAMVHGIAQLSGRIQVRREGEWRHERPVRAVEVRYPGVHAVRCYTIGHPEPVTLPRTFPGIRDSVNVMICDAWTARAIRLLGRAVDGGWLSLRTAARIAERAQGTAPPDLDAAEALAAVDAGRALPPLFAVARGTSGGRDVRVGATLRAAPPGGMGGYTGVPLGVVASMIAEGSVHAPGVHAPEACVPLAPFFDRLGEFTEPAGSGGDLVRLDRANV